MSSGGLPVGGAGSALEVPDRAAENAVLDQRHALLGHALEVEPLREPPRVESVVGDRDLLVEAAFADPAAEIAPVFEQGEAAEGVEREVLQQLAESDRAEHRAVGARRNLARIGGPARDLDRFSRDRSGVDVADGPGGLLAV